MKPQFLLIALICLLFRPSLNAQSDSNPSGDFINIILKQHNIYRAAVHCPPLTWSASLAADAQAWAKKLARSDHAMHDQSIVGKEGENLFWGTASAFGPAEMVDVWAGEKKNFVYGTFPDCATSKSAVVGHYTQMVWKTTTSVGCAIASNGQMDYLVCRYGPAGNILGQKPY